jgi:hypothetical protein
LAASDLIGGMVMQMSVRVASVVLAIIATVIVTVMRILLTPGMQDVDTGAFHISYVIIGIMVVSMAAIWLLAFIGKGTFSLATELDNRTRKSLATALMFSGIILTISSLFDGWRWLFVGQTPPPNDTLINSLDGITLTLTILFGVLAGAFLITLSTMLSKGRLKRSPALSLSALAPVFWIWIRIVRDEISYSSAVQVYQSFYDFMMLIITMLFLFAFARYISATGTHSPRLLMALSLCTVLLSISGPLTSIAMYLSKETEAYNASRLAGITDFGMGIFAAFVAVALVLSKKNALPAAAMAQDQALQENKENHMPMDEDSLGGIRSDEASS